MLAGWGRLVHRFRLPIIALSLLSLVPSLWLIFHGGRLATADIPTTTESGRALDLIGRELPGRPPSFSFIFSSPTRAVRDPAFRQEVERAWRGRGVGKALLQHLLSAARQLEYHKMVLATFPYNDAGLALYRRMGFSPVGVYHEQGKLDGALKDLRRENLDGAALVVAALDVALSLEITEVLVHRRERVIVEVRRDLFEARGVAVLLAVRRQIIQNLALALGERHKGLAG